MKLFKLLLISITAIIFTACETTSHKYSRSYAWADSDGVYDSYNVEPEDKLTFNASNDMNAFRGNTFIASLDGNGTESDSDMDGIPDKMDKDYVESAQDTTTVKRKIAYTANVSLTVENNDSIANYVTKIAETYGGYMTYSNSYTITIKVKADSMKAAIAKIEALGEVRSSSISSQDVTDQYTDLNIRLENAMKARERYLELLEKAANVQEALLVEKELERLNLTIDQLKGTLNQLGDRIVYSTITVTYYKKKDDGPKPGILGYVFVGIYKGVKWLFVRD